MLVVKVIVPLLIINLSCTRAAIVETPAAVNEIINQVTIEPSTLKTTTVFSDDDTIIEESEEPESDEPESSEPKLDKPESQYRSQEKSDDFIKPQSPFDFYYIIEGVQDFIRNQVNSAEKSINNLEIKARESFNLTGIFLNQLIIETEMDLSHQVMSMYKNPLDEAKSDINSPSTCLTDESIVKLSDIVNAARPDIRECARVANSYSNKLLRKILFDLHEIFPKLVTLHDMVQPCIREPGIGEKINCLLEKVEDTQAILVEMMYIAENTIRNIVTDFSANIKVASNCMTGVASNTLSDVNTVVVKRRECAAAGNDGDASQE